MLRYLVPLVIFAVLAGFLYIGLSLNPQAVPSPLIDKPAPSFELSQLHSPAQTVSRETHLGKVWLLNVWASWCVSCRQEHPLLMQLARSGEVPIVGLNYKDTRAEAVGWLEDFGDPYTVSGFDVDGRVGVDYGVYGVPETYVIDKQGVIRHKHTGPVTVEALRNEILPLVRKLNG
ncbi:thiol:disulfide interchange protein [Candidatus Tenderia electrophaga]|jgi:cytochrome c biogenesis protein CcmG/thiol:disulfide interchange protein DsbE|uniref:Thiol:disulfide interchange protein n=1 Tax=Candidatus Tenderia electrophaga TaxID=1748243 RepID=A0A0S2THL6_9GAMM|nr:thiol:disulfide interchange protein [Candidatus Tenderia electrophaga]